MIKQMTVYRRKSDVTFFKKKSQKSAYVTRNLHINIILPLAHSVTSS